MNTRAFRLKLIAVLILAGFYSLSAVAAADDE